MGNELLSNATEAPDETPLSGVFPPLFAEEMPDDDELEMPEDDDPWSDDDWDDDKDSEDDDSAEDDDDESEAEDDDDWDDDWDDNDDDDDGVEARRRDERSRTARPKPHGRHGSDRRHARGTRRVID